MDGILGYMAGYAWKTAVSFYLHSHSTATSRSMSLLAPVSIL